MKNKIVRFALVVLIFGMGSLCAFGQAGATSSISGVVVDSSGAVIPGAAVTARHNATGAEFRAVTAENGAFTIPALDPGEWEFIHKHTAK